MQKVLWQLTLVTSMTLVGSKSAVAQQPTDSKDVDYWTDKFSAAQYWDTKLWGLSAWDGSGTSMTARKVVLVGGSVSYLLVVERREHDWAFLRGPSEWLIDGQRVSVGSEEDGSENAKSDVQSDKYTGVWVVEKAFYTGVTPDFFRSLAGASEVELRLNGQRDTYTKKLGKKELERAKHFYEAVVQADAAAISPTPAQAPPLPPSGQPADQSASEQIPTAPPPGAKFVADAVQKVYAPVTCHDAFTRMDPANRYYYQTEAAAVADGYARAAGCPR